MTSTPEVLPVTAPAVGVAGPQQGQWTYDAYAAIPDDGKRYEVIEGVLYVAPAPNVAHQAAVTQFAIRLGSFILTADLGQIFVSPIDVELPPGRTIVQPGVVVILHANRGIITPSRIVGAPDLVIEVASPSTATHDRSAKLAAYARAGVREYWLADPYAQTVELLWLVGEEYVSAGVFSSSALLPSRVVRGLPVRVEQFFA
jgi:Uma2 family endonuclease